MRSILVTFGLVAAALAQADYAFLVTETPYGSNPPSNYKGILRYGIDGGGNATAKTGIDASAVNDPAGLTISSTGEVYVGNRHGNQNPSSVSRFLYDPVTDSYVANGTITGGGLYGVHGLNFSPSGELYAANVSGGLSRFAGTTPAGTVGSATTRDVLFSPNGKWFYVTEGVSGNVLQYDAATNAFVSSFNVSGASGFHFGTWRGSDLYIGDYGSGRVFDLTFDAVTGGLASSAAVATATSAISVAFSPDGNEMFVPGHTSGSIARFVMSGGSWVANGSIVTGVNMGDIQIVQSVPEPASIAALGMSALALLRRRRR